MTAFPFNVYLLHNLLTAVQSDRRSASIWLVLFTSEVYWIQIISQMFCGDPQAMNLGNEVKKKKETWILGRFGRKNWSLTWELWHLICCCFYSFFFFLVSWRFACCLLQDGFDMKLTNCRTTPLHNEQIMPAWRLGSHLHKVTHLP